MYVKVCFLFLLSLVLVSAGFPTYSGWVNDNAQILTAEGRASLEELFIFVEQNTTAEVVFVSVNSTAPDAPQEYRTKLFREWKVGKEDTDNGLLMVYSVAEKRFEIEVGYGLEGILPDGKVGRLLDEWYVPARDGGNVSEGIALFSSAIVDEIMLNADEVRSGQTRVNEVDTLGEVLLILLIFGLFVWFWWYVVHGPGRKRFGIFPLFFGGGSGGHSSFGGSGGGFSGFGGGMSGGGGAGR